MLSSAGCGGTDGPGMMPTDGGNSMMDGGSPVDAHVADGGATSLGDGGAVGTCVTVCHQILGFCPHSDDVNCEGLCAYYANLAPSCESQREADFRCAYEGLIADPSRCDTTVSHPEICRDLDHALRDCVDATSDDPCFIFRRNALAAGCSGFVTGEDTCEGVYTKTYLSARDCEDERQAAYRCAIDHPCDPNTSCATEFAAMDSCRQDCNDRRDDCGRCLRGCDLCVASWASMPCASAGTCVSGTCECPSGTCYSVEDNCVANDRPSGCGASCTACPWPMNGSATCTAGVCGAVCNPGFTYDPASHTCA